MRYLWKPNTNVDSRNFLDTRFQSLVDDLFKDFSLEQWQQKNASRFVPKINVMEREHEYVITTELPGLEEKDFEVSMEDGVLRIKGEKRHHFEEGDKATSYRYESSYGAFERALTLPEGIDLEKSKAQFKNGLLTLTIAKNKAESKVHKFKIDTH